MLQGHPSRFWGALHDRLLSDGHEVFKVHLCLADRIFWGRRPATSYRGAFRNWNGWIGAQLDALGITDILYYADRLPYHREALAEARRRGIRCWAIEFGYLRPDWITLEAEGMGAYSNFPRDPDTLARLAEDLAAPDLKNRFPHPFSAEAFYEVTFHLLQAYGRPFYPFYVSDKIYWPAIDYLSWLVELARSPQRTRGAEALETRIRAGGMSYNLVALQLQADYQIRASSPYAHLADFVDEVLASFSRCAPAERELVFKVHPLDNGLEHWFRRIPRLARQHGVEARVHVVKGGNLEALLAASKGVALVNSTVGIHALRMGVPTYAGGSAVFDLPGLTHQGALDAFWTDPEPVSTGFFQTFERALTRIQVKGSFFNPEGRDLAVAEISRRIGRGEGYEFSMM